MSGELELGVCGWCIDRHDTLRGIEIAARELGQGVVQIGFFSSQAVQTASAERIRAVARELGVRLAGAFVAFEGEDYSSIARIAETGGFALEDRLAERVKTTRDVIDIAVADGASSVAFHAGTVPAERDSGLYQRLLSGVREAAEACAAKGVRLLLESGRESADLLISFLNAVDRPNVGVNFDCGNFVVYGTDEPASAVSKLKGRVELVHLKDAFHSAKPGVEYGRPAPLGQGDVQVARVVSKLRATGYRGPLLIECDTREAGLDAIRSAANYLRTLLA